MLKSNRMATLCCVGIALVSAMIAGPLVRATESASASVVVDMSIDLRSGSIDSTGSLQVSRNSAAAISFDVPEQVATADQVILRLQTERPGGDAEIAVVEGDRRADEIDWRNPPVLHPLDVSLPAGIRNEWVEVDVSNAVSTAGVFTFVITRTKSGSFFSSESSSTPQLVSRSLNPPNTTAMPAGSVETSTPISAPADTLVANSETVVSVQTVSGRMTQATETNVVATVTGPTKEPITALAETQPVPHSGDAADDSAIWIDRANPARSAIIGTDKLGGIGVYDLSGAQLHFYTPGRINNVDLREDFPFGDHRGAIVAATERDADQVLFFEIDPVTRGLRPAGSVSSSLGVAGVCMYRSAQTGSYSVFVSDSSGSIEQWALRPTGNDVTGSKVRTIRVSSTTEGCVVDDELARLYISEEDKGIWRFPAEASDPTPPVIIDQTTAAGGSRLYADIEGLAILHGAAGTGYLVASSQGNSTFVVYDRASNGYVATFSIASGQIDGVDHTDGIEITSARLGDAYPEGLFVTQDNTNDSSNQNFKLVSWQSIAASAIGTIASPTTSTTSTTPTTTPTPTTVPGTVAPTPTTTTTVPSGTAAIGRVYYVNAQTGADSNIGTRPDAAWRTLRFAASRLRAGDRVLLHRDQQWNEKLEISVSGTGAQPIVIDSYGNGANPVITGSSSCVRLNGNHITVRGLTIRGCTWAGVSVVGSNNRIIGNLITNNVAGVYVKATAVGTVIVGNEIRDNNLMAVNDIGGAGDSGAFGVLIHGHKTVVAYNVISGSDAHSYDYGRDGAAIEIYGGRDNHIHHNRAFENHAFAELGQSGASGNRFDNNVVSATSETAVFLVTRGPKSSRGPVLGTVVEHNSVLLTGIGSQGFVCHGGCSTDVLTLRNNIIEASWKAGYADGAFVGGHNVFSGGLTQFALDPTDVVADPGWVDRVSVDLHLAGDSPAIDIGAPLGYPTDFDGAPIDGVWPDAGAYQFANS